MSNGSRPLDGLRAVDLSGGVAASFAAKLLADYGADVVKVEPLDGSPERALGPFPDGAADTASSGMFLYLNTNKRSLSLDLESDRGKETVEVLIRHSDTVILGDTYREAARWLDDVSVLRGARESGMVVTAVTPYGLTGPYRTREAEEINVFGFGGPMWATGVPEREPMMYPEYVALIQAGAAAGLATLMAHFGRQLGGAGSLIDVAITEVLLGSWDRRAYSLQSYQYAGEVPSGRMHSHALAFGAYRCRDGFVTLAAQGARFPKLLALIGREDLLSDPRFSGFSATFDPSNFEALNAILAGWLMERTHDEVFHAGQRSGVLVAPVLTPSETLEDEHLRLRGFWTEIEDGGDRYELPGPPLILHGDSPPSPSQAPKLGEHSDVVLHELGYSPTEIATLRARGVL